MKIVYNIAGAFSAGGMERVLTNKVNYLVSKGHELIIVTTDQKDRKPYFELNGKVKQIDLAINYQDIQSLNLLAKFFAYRRKQKLHQKKLSELLKILKADIVISMFDQDATCLYRINDGSKKLLEIHFSRYKRLQYGRKGVWAIIDRLRSAWDLRLVKKYDRFVVLTEEDKSYWGALPNIQVIPNANSFSPKSTATLNEKVAVAVGRLDYQKGFDDLIKIWAMVQPVFPDWQLKIYGEGKLENELKQLIEELDLAQQVHLCKPTKNIEEVYCSSTLYLMTSRYEGLPMALLEAQACGLPLIAYACKCGPKDIIEQGRNGYLIAEGDKVEFVRRLRELLSNDALRKKMGEEAQKMSQRYQEKIIMESWLSMFVQLLEKKT